MMNSHLCANADYFRRFVRNPRVSNEMITPYKGFFEKAVPEQDREAYLADPMKRRLHGLPEYPCDKGLQPGRLANHVRKGVEGPYSRCAQRDIFFVSMARSMGVPARIDEVTGKVQLIGDEGAIDVNFEAMEQASALTGKFIARYTPIKSLADPKYYSHFTLSKFKDGVFQLLNYDEGDVDMGKGATWAKSSKEWSKTGFRVLYVSHRKPYGKWCSAFQYHFL